MTPTQQIVDGSSRWMTVVDATGRRLSVRRLNALDTLRLFKAAGPTLSENEAWLSLAGLAFSVQEIDGVPVPAPTNEIQIEGIIDRLGDEGLNAIVSLVREEPLPAEMRTDVGNSLGTLS